MKKFLSLLLCVVLACTLILNVGAVGLDHVQGGVDPHYDDMNNDEIFLEAIENPELTSEQRDNLIWKQKLLEQQSTIAVEPRINCELLVKAIMQDTQNSCSAATIQMALNYLGENYDTQSKIMQNVGAGPGLSQVINYMNKAQNQVAYMLVKWSGQDELESICSAALKANAPIFFTMRAYNSTVNEGTWPYSCPYGHYTILKGYVSGRFSTVFTISDPYYFENWIGLKGANGMMTRSYEQIEEVNLNQGRGYNYVAM